MKLRDVTVAKSPRHSFHGHNNQCLKDFATVNRCYKE